ncbi:MAG: hypothetical protein DRN83_01015 [Hadesarchaea archaeon]|nr:MAG: hypothetical protein DRN83_01015 [Hadesarchaea archaeon]HDI12898.1 AAA family ATPase [Hadesarchaea archaeon]
MGLLDRFKDIFKGPEKPIPKFTPFEVVEVKKGSYVKFEMTLKKYGLIMLIVGKRGSGKSALGMQFLAWFHHIAKRRCYGIGYGSAKLPKWIRKAKNVDEIPNDSVVLIDEAAILFFSRESMTSMNKMLSKLMAIARHKNLSMILISQSSAMIEVNVLRLADVLLLKEPSMFQARFERKALQDIFRHAKKIFRELDDPTSYFYVYSDEFEGLVRYELPYFWNDSISRSFREFRNK